MSDHHRQMIRYSVKHLEFVEEQIGELDLAIASKIKATGLQEQWDLLQTAARIQERSAATILAETGGDMEQFPSSKHLSSWAGVCPGNNRSAGKNKSSRTTGGNPWLRAAPHRMRLGSGRQEGLFSARELQRNRYSSGFT